MPYLDREWMIEDERLQAGTWVPERNWDRWSERASVRAPWRMRHDPEPTGRTRPSRVPTLDSAELDALAADLGNAQRDRLFYANLIEQLKSNPSDAMADKVVEDMQTLGFASASWPEAVGGPPPHQSPRPWRRVLSWLFQKIAAAGKFVLRCIEFASASLTMLGVSTVSISFGLTGPSVGFSFTANLFDNWDNWVRARDFVGKTLRDLEQAMY